MYELLDRPFQLFVTFLTHLDSVRHATFSLFLCHFLIFLCQLVNLLLSSYPEYSFVLFEKLCFIHCRYLIFEIVSYKIWCREYPNPVFTWLGYCFNTLFNSLAIEEIDQYWDDKFSTKIWQSTVSKPQEEI